MFSILHKGNFDKTDAFLKLASSGEYLTKLNALGERGVMELAAATPILTGETAGSWRYEVKRTSNSLSITWLNDVYAGSAPLSILLQYGHGTRQGGYVSGIDYINPAMKPVFDAIADEAWAVLTNH